MGAELGRCPAGGRCPAMHGQPLSPNSQSNQKQSAWPVTLQVYNMGSPHCWKANAALHRAMNAGAFHCGVEVHSREWSYEDTGVFCCDPGAWWEAAHFDSIVLGKTTLSEIQVIKVLDKLKEADFRGSLFNIISHNCCNFSDTFCSILGVGSIPRWVMNLATVGTTVRDVLDTINPGCCRQAPSGSCPPSTCLDACSSEPVTLNVYSIGVSKEVLAVNAMLHKFGTGAFHCGVEVYKDEWSYEGMGIFCCEPRKWSAGSFFKSIPLGRTPLSKVEVLRRLDRLKEREWVGSDYDVLEHNCCHFCNAFCADLKVEPIPNWVTNLADAGVVVRDTVLSFTETSESGMDGDNVPVPKLVHVEKARGG